MLLLPTINSFLAASTVNGPHVSCLKQNLYAFLTCLPANLPCPQPLDIAAAVRVLCVQGLQHSLESRRKQKRVRNSLNLVKEKLGCNVGWTTQASIIK